MKKVPGKGNVCRDVMLGGQLRPADQVILLLPSKRPWGKKEGVGYPPGLLGG